MRTRRLTAIAAIEFTPPADCHHPPCTPYETGIAVLRELRRSIEFGRPTASAVASALSMNLRTLQRHLRVLGVTFEGVLDEYRRCQAIDYLNQRSHSITEIAFRLGYSDSAHFTRAFRRWTGGPPGRSVAGRDQAESTA